MNATKYNVIAIWGSQKYGTDLGTYDTLGEARNRVDEIGHRPGPESIYHQSKFDELKIVKVTESLVWFSTNGSDQNKNLSESSSLSPAAEPTPVDYERQGVQVRDTFQPFDDLQGEVRHLEDRFVGLRHECHADIDHAFETIESLKDNLAADIDNLDGAMRHEVAGLRREMETLRSELETLRGRTEFPRGRGA